jgi:hypothetical protein
MPDQEEYLTRCVVDTSKRTFNIYSNLGTHKFVECDTVDEFMNVLSVVRDQVDENMIAYSELL